MNARFTRRRVMAGLAAVAVVILAVWGFWGGRREATQERERERPVKAPRRVSIQNGEVVLTLDAATQARAGLVVEPIAAGTERQEIRGYATVVDVAALASARNDAAAARAAAEKARAAVEATRRELERLRTLHADAQNVSTKAVEAAQAQFRTEQAGAEAAAAQVRTAEATARQNWGPVLGRWVAEGSPGLARLLDRKDVLVQITVPPDVPLARLPVGADVFVGAARVPVRLLSAAARTDPRIQGLSALYVAPAQPGLELGMNLGAAIPSGTDVAGGVVPGSAVVFTEGQGWVYVHTSPSTFARRPIATDMRGPGGGYVAKSLAAGTPVVVRGAQALLSEEFRSQIEVGEEHE